MRNAIALMVMLTATAVLAQDVAEESWHPSKHGAGDTLGAINHLSRQTCCRPHGW